MTVRGTDVRGRFDYRSELLRHEMFVGREALMARLDDELVSSGRDRWVVVTGGPGMGKSAVLSAWLKRRQAAGAAVPHHFIRRGMNDWDEPARIVDSLIEQLDASFPCAHELEPSARMNPAARLEQVLWRVSDQGLVPRDERLVVLIDGLDEYDGPTRASQFDPLAAFLPHALPRGVSFLCASRPRHPYISRIEARAGDFVEIDLDAPDFAADNDATVRAFWDAAAGPLGLDGPFIEQAVARADGNVQYAVLLRRQLQSLPPQRRRVEDIPRGLAALLEEMWERIAQDPLVVEGLGILCAAREALTLDELGTAAAWTAEATRRAFLHGAAEVLVETERPDRQPEYRLHHEAIRAYIAQTIGDSACRSHHRTLAQRLATWPASVSLRARRYALRYALLHRVEAGDVAEAWQIGGDTSFLEAKCRELGAHELEVDTARVAEHCRVSGERDLGPRFSDLARALARESHWLQVAPEATAALVWNRLRRSGWSEQDLGQQLQIPATTMFLRVRHAAARESPALVRDLVGHAGEVTACAVTPDGQRVVSASEDGTLMVWDLESGRILATLKDHVDAVTACAVTPDGRRVVSGSSDHTLKVWDLKSQSVLVTLEGHTSAVTACAVTPDGRRVVSASYDQTVKVWDLESGCVLATLDRHAHWVRACAVTPDGRRAISASRDATLKVWDLETRCVITTVAGQVPMTACAVTPDGRRMVSSEGRTLRMWDLESGEAIASLEGHAAEVRACAVTPDGRRMVSASEDQTLKVWDLETWHALSTLDGHADCVTACAVTPDGRRMVSASGDGTLKVWDLESAGTRPAEEGHAEGVTACVATPCGGRVVSASEDGTLKVWDAASGRALAHMQGDADAVSACAVTPDGRRVVSASKGGTLKTWDLESGRALDILEGQVGWVTACAVTPDGRRIISGSDHGILTVWDLETRRPLVMLERHRDRITGLAITPDGQRVVSASADRTLVVSDLESGRACMILEDHCAGVMACTLTPDGRRVVSASADGTLKIWDLQAGQLSTTLKGHAHHVMACAVTPDGQHAVSASSDRTLKVWHLARGVCVSTHRGGAPYRAVAASKVGVVAGDILGNLWFLDSVPSDPPSSPVPTVIRLRPGARKHSILFIASNPVGTRRRDLDDEARAIEDELERSGHQDCFELKTCLAARPLDLLHRLRSLKPAVLHFSGRSSRKPGGLFFRGPDRRPQVVTAEALRDAFGAVQPSVTLVILSACYSDAHAELLRAHVDCVIGMSGSVSDATARSFASGFYGGLGGGEPIAAAFDQGCAAIGLEGLHDGDRPQLKVRDGVDASRITFAVERWLPGFDPKV